MKIINYTLKNKKVIVAEVVKELKAGGLVIYPTETCYGVAVLTDDNIAVKRLLEYKRRPEGKAISVAVNSLDMAKKYVDVNSTAKSIYKKYLPGPVTVISQSLHKVSQELESEDGNLGVRIPDNDLALAIITALKKPITATSANSSGKKTPYKISDVLDNISAKQLDLVSIIIDAGELAHNPPSTVIDTTKEELKILRQGDINFTKSSLEILIKSPLEMSFQGELLIKRHLNSLQEKSLLIMFNAELGAGKTQFIKGIAKGLGITEMVNSPTFVLMKEYQYSLGNDNKKLIHLDAWRMESLKELSQLNIEGYLLPGNVVAVEWAGIAKDFLESIANSLAIEKIYIEIDYTSLEERLLKIYE